MKNLNSLSKVLIAIFLAAIFSNFIMPVYAGAPGCGFSSQPGRTIINLAVYGGIRADQGESEAIHEINGLNLKSGTYNIGLHSWDDHSSKYQPDQTNERFFVQFLNSGGSEITRSNSISDIPDNTDNVIQTVNQKLQISQNIDSIIVRHSDWPGSNANSLLPVCMALDAKTQPNKPPKISSCNPSTTTINLGETATIFYSISDPDGDSLSVSVDWGDGTTTNGGTNYASHLYANSGTYSIRITVTDSKGAYASSTCGSIIVKPVPNNPPYISSCSVSTPIVYLGTAAYINYIVSDPEGDSVSIVVNWGDGTTSTGGSSTANHVYYSTGTYSVTITATDSKGASTSKSCGTITVIGTPTNNPPVINSCTPPYSPVEAGKTATINYNIYDPDLDYVTVKINWGDGTSSTGGSSSASHIYSYVGTYSITITATDSKGASTSKSCGTITVTSTTNNPPVISSCSPATPTVTLGSTASINYAVSDPNGDSFTVVVNWGDGTSSTGGSSSASHVYTSTGTYSVSIIATDSKGASTSKSCESITVTGTPTNNPPVISSCTSPVTVIVNTAATIYYSVSDPNGDSFTVVVNWGDGTSSIGGPSSASHVYTITGTYSITITATDSKGASTSKSCGTITVLPTTNNPPVISSCSLSSSSITLGDPVTATYSVTDPEGDAITNVVAWGDGTSSTGGSSTASYTYPGAGTFSATLTSTDSKGAVSTKSCGSVTVSSVGIPPTPSGTCAKLKITDVDAKVDGRTDNNLRDNDDISRKAGSGSKLEFKVTVKNLYNRTEDVDLENVQVTVTLEGIDDGDDIEEESKDFDLRPGNDKTVTLRFELPVDVEEGGYGVNILAQADDGKGGSCPDHEDEIDVDLDVEREKHDLGILRLNLNKAAISCNDGFILNYDIINLGQEDEKNAYVEITNDDLGIDFVERGLSVNSDIGSNKISKSNSLKPGSGLSDGIYPIDVVVYTDNGILQDSGTVSLELKGCGSPITPTGAKETNTTVINYQLAGTEYIEKTIQIPFIEVIFGGRNRGFVLLLVSTFILSIFFLIVAMVAMVRDEE